MTKEEILKAFAADETFCDKTGVNADQVVGIKFSEKTKSKLIEVIKMAIDGVCNNEGEGTIGRRINSFLNK